MRLKLFIGYLIVLCLSCISKVSAQDQNILIIGAAPGQSRWKNVTEGIQGYKINTIDEMPSLTEANGIEHCQFNFCNKTALDDFVANHVENFDIIINDHQTFEYISWAADSYRSDYLITSLLKTLKPNGEFYLGPIYHNNYALVDNSFLRNSLEALRQGHEYLGEKFKTLMHSVGIAWNYNKNKTKYIRLTWDISKTEQDKNNIINAINEIDDEDIDIEENITAKGQKEAAQQYIEAMSQYYSLENFQNYVKNQCPGIQIDITVKAYNQQQDQNTELGHTLQLLPPQMLSISQKPAADGNWIFMKRTM